MPVRTLPGAGLRAFYDAGQTGWNATVDPDFRLISVLLGGSVVSSTAPLPGSGSAGDVYIVRSDDVSNPNRLAVWDGEAGAEAWVFIDPLEGWTFRDRANGFTLQWDGATWAALVQIASAFDVDVETVPPTAGQVLAWDDVNSLWVPATITGGGGASSLGALSDVDLATTPPVADQALIYDGTSWVPGAGVGGNGVSSYAGAEVTVSTDKAGLDFGTALAAVSAWDLEVSDTNDFWALANPSRFTIPASGVSRVRVAASLSVFGTTVDEFVQCFFCLNGNTGVRYGGQRVQCSVDNTLLTTAADIPVTGGDYIELYCRTGGDTSVDIQADESRITIEVIEGPLITASLAINDLTDVDTQTNAPTDGQRLAWDAALGAWVPGGGGASPDAIYTTLIDHSFTGAAGDDDVRVTGAASYDELIVTLVDVQCTANGFIQAATDSTFATLHGVTRRWVSDTFDGGGADTGLFVMGANAPVGMDVNAITIKGHRTDKIQTTLLGGITPIAGDSTQAETAVTDTLALINDFRWFSGGVNPTSGRLIVVGVNYNGVKASTREEITLSGALTDWNIPDGAKRVQLISASGITLDGAGTFSIQLRNGATLQPVKRSSGVLIGGNAADVFNSPGVGEVTGLGLADGAIVGFSIELLDPRESSSKTRANAQYFAQASGGDGWRIGPSEQVTAADTNVVRFNHTGNSVSGTVYALVDYA